MKYKRQFAARCEIIVAPFTGAWIEIKLSQNTKMTSTLSHPSRVRGLKSANSEGKRNRARVAPFTGAWIEISPFAVSGNLSI